MWMGGSPIAWKSSRQPFPALSNGEAELIEVIESVILGDSVNCMIEEMVGSVHKTLKCDNTAAIALGSSATGAWRTRHLKVRAAYLRWKLEAGVWGLQFQPGKGLVADLGTKVLAPTRVQNLMRMMGMGWQPKGGDMQEDKPEENLPVVERLWLEKDVKKVTQLVTVIATLQKVQGALAVENATEVGNEDSECGQILYIFGAIMVILRSSQPEVAVRSLRMQRGSIHAETYGIHGESVIVELFEWRIGCGVHSTPTTRGGNYSIDEVYGIIYGGTHYGFNVDDDNYKVEWSCPTWFEQANLYR